MIRPMRMILYMKNTHIINIITSVRVDRPQINIYGGLSSTE
jgi:hypothetical protein